MDTNSDSSIEYVYIDESGKTEIRISRENTPDYYVICGIFILNNRMPEFKQKADALVHRHAAEGELTSDDIGSRIDRRKQILADIAHQNFPFYCLVINKQRIWQDSGLQWKRSYYTFLHEMLCHKISQSAIAIHAIADQYGTSEFMESFKRYIQTRSLLFNRFEFASSKDVSLLQIADVVAGSVRRVFLNKDPVDLIEQIGYPSISIEEWPPFSTTLPLSGKADQKREFDALILDSCLNSARKFVETNIESDLPNKILQAEAIRYLLYRFNQNPKEYVYRYELVSHLKQQKERSINTEFVSRNLLAIARDEGVILASTDKGIKIPYGAQDIRDWIGRVNSQIAPHLKRIKEARAEIFKASHNEYDIIDPEVHPDLWRYLNSQEQ